MAAYARLARKFTDFDTATLFYSSQANSTDYKAANLQNIFVGQPWRTDTDLGEWSKWDLGSAKLVKGFSLFNFNLTDAASVTLQASATDSWVPPDFSATLPITTDPDGDVYKRLVYFLDETYRYWRLVISDPTNPDGYIQIARAMGWPYYEFVRNIRDNPRWVYADPSEGDRIPGTQSAVVQKEPFRRLRFGIPLTLRAQRDEVVTWFRKNGHFVPAVLCLDPDNYPSIDSAYCTIETELEEDFVQGASAGYYDFVQIVLEEKTR